MGKNKNNDPFIDFVKSIKSDDKYKPTVMMIGGSKRWVRRMLRKHVN